MDLSTRIGKHLLKNPIMNAAGVNCVTEYQLNRLLQTKSCGAIVTKSSTVDPRQGNPNPRYFSDDFFSINSSGLPNLGIDSYITWIRNNNSNKPCILSISPMKIDDLSIIIKKIKNDNTIIDPEINLSCPNIEGKSQVGYDFDTFSLYLRKLSDGLGDKTYGLKLPPYFDNTHFQSIANIINEHPTISYVTCINSIPLGLYVDIEKERKVIIPNDGFGGFGGSSILPTALANVNKFSKLLKNKQVIGCGGIKSGDDIYRHFLCGASAVQIGTTLYNNGVSDFERLTQEFATIMERKGKSRLSDIICV